jgi:hypothetical protein
MLRVTLFDHLAEAERHVEAGGAIVACQREIVAGLTRVGHDATQANELLVQLERLQVMHVADRDQFRRELGIR